MKGVQTDWANLLKGKIGTSAGAYPGAVTSGIDPMTLMAAQIMMGMQGGQYKPPSFLGAQGIPGYGGTGTQPVGQSAQSGTTWPSGMSSAGDLLSGNDFGGGVNGGYGGFLKNWLEKNKGA